MVVLENISKTFFRTLLFVFCTALLVPAIATRA